MAYYDLVWFCNAGDQATTGYYAVAKRPQNAAVVAGQLCRQFTAPAVGSERVFVCIIAGTTANTTDATWVLTRGAKTTDGTATWMEVTGMAAVNGDAADTLNWTAAKAIGTPSLGAIIKRNNGASYQICTTAGTLGAAEPAFSDTAGVTTTETSATTVWTSLGVVGSFTGGQAPHARLNNALANGWFVANNTVYVGNNSAESQAANISYGSSIGSSAGASSILCHDHSGPYPPGPGNLTSGAAVIVTGSGGSISITPTGMFYLYGIAFLAGATSGGSPDIFVGAVTNTYNWYCFDNCSLQLAETSGAGNGVIVLGGSSGSSCCVIILNNTTVKFGAAGDIIAMCLNRLVWQNTGPILAAGSVAPTVLFKTNANTATAMADVLLEALDLSQLTGSLYSNVGYPSNTNIAVKDCKLNASMTVTTPALSGSSVQLIRSDGGATAYKSARYVYEGTETTETSITRVGGASDPTGQAQSRKIVTTANAQWLRPFKAEPYAIWNPTFGPGSGDPYWSSVKLLMGFEGANNSTGAPGMNDESPAANGTASVSGSDRIDTSQFKFGVSSLLCSGIVSYPDNVNFALGSTPFTVEAWVRPSSVSGGVMCFIAKFGSAAPNLGWTLYQNNAVLTFNGSPDGTTNTTIMSGGTLVINTWQHVCADFDGTKYRLYLNGVMVGSSTTLVNIFNPSTKPLAIGCNSDVALVYSGWIDEVRLTKGTARYANDAGFSVPTAAFPRTASTGVTVTVCGTINAGALPNNDDIWLEVEYLGSSSFPIGTIKTTTKANLLAANAAVASDSSTWNGGGSGVGWSPFKLTATLASPQPGMAGYLHARVRAAKPSATFYIDPQITLS